ncbi:MAG TPA: anti-sigma factor [Methylomirabilota bacterium]|nr:anti-sigma factor [Methylomirabilota bacterium]
MNCHETRERLSDLLDEALAAPERAEVGVHLDGCPDCRRELDRLRATVSLLSRVERPRAPVGFVDRVIAAARPVPWYQRLGRRFFLPLNIKLPAQAAAMLLIAVLGVYLLQRTPELRDAARPELQSPAARSEPSGTTTAAPTPPPAPDRKDLKAGKVDSGNLSEPAPLAAREAENTVRAERRLDSPQSSPPLTQEYKQEPKKEADADRLQKAGAPAASPAEPRAKSRDAAEGQSGTLAPTPPAMSAKRQSAMSSVLGRLIVKNRPAAEQGLADLLARLGGSETGRRQELEATVVEVLVPEARYADFVRGLTTLGAFTPEGQPVALPTEPPQIRLSIRITE